MGNLTDLVPGGANDAEKIGNSMVPSEEFGGIDIKGIDSVKFITLHETLLGRSFDELLPLYDPVYAASEEEGPWVSLIPSELVARLATLSASERQATAQQWSRTDEFIADRWQQNDVATVLEKICGLAASATASKQHLYLWLSL